MHIVKQSHRIIGECPSNTTDGLKRIERVGRICYQSMDKINEESYLPFVKKLVDKKHGAMLEHSNLVLKIPNYDYYFRSSRILEFKSKLSKYLCIHETPHITSDIGYNNSLFIGGSYRAWMEWIDYSGDLRLLPIQAIKKIEEFNISSEECLNTKEDPIPRPLRRFTVEFNTNRAITHQLVRHRPIGIAQLSQRYVRHLGSIQFIAPVGMLDENDNVLDREFYKNFKESCIFTENMYQKMLKNCSPQKARNVLTNAVASQITVTANIPQWEFMFDLRCASDADPQMIDLMTPVREESKNW